MDKNLLIKAAGEGDFAPRPEFLNTCLLELKVEARGLLKEVASWLRSEIAASSEVRYSSEFSGSTFDLESVCADTVTLAENWLERADIAIASGGILELRDTLESLPNLHRALVGTNAAFTSYIANSLNDRATETGENCRIEISDGNKSNSETGKLLEKAPFLIGGGFFLISLLSSLSSCSSGQVGQVSTRLLVALSEGSCSGGSPWLSLP